MNDNININDSTITTELTFRNLVIMRMQQLTNFPYIEEDFDALTDYQLLCLVVKYLNDVIENQNEQNSTITNLYQSFLALQDYVNNTKDTLEDAFNELNDYVRDYFANLDVQEEINNKLDAMVEDGTLEEIISNYLDIIIKYYCLTKSSATHIVQFKDGKNLLIDTGKSEEWLNIAAAVNNLGITKFDYLILTHFHSDHIGNLTNFLNTYDFSDCICWVGMKPDYTNHSADIDELESAYDDVIDYLESRGITPIVPVNDSYYTIDNDTKLHFLNTSPTIAENYYGAYTEYREETGVNLNQFSLITEVLFKDNVLTFTGDIERVVEQYMSPFMRKSDVYVIPHHGVNRDCDKQFYKAVNPKYAIATYLTTSTTWVSIDKKELREIYELGSNIFSSHYTETDNDLFEFICDGFNVRTNCKGYGIPQNIYDIDNNYSNMQSILQPTIKPYTETTIADIFNNLSNGSSLKMFWWDSYNTNYVNLFNELQALFPLFTNNFEVEFRKGQTSYVKEIIVHNANLEFQAISYNSNYNWDTKGNGLLSNTSGQSNLIDLILKLPKGNYYMSTYTPDDAVLTHSGHAINITVIGKWTQNNSLQANALINGTLRHTGEEVSNTSRVIFGYINTAGSPQAIWYKFNNFSA